MRGKVLIAVLAAIPTAFVAGRCSSPEPPVRYERVTVPVQQIVRAKPDTIRQVVERIVYRAVPAETRAEAPGAGAAAVAGFCADRDTVRIMDTVHVAAATRAAPPARRLALVEAGRYDGEWLSLWELTNDGALAREDFRVRPPWQFAMRGDSAFVQGSRWWWLRELGECGLPTGGAVLVGGDDKLLRGATVAGLCLLSRFAF
jgi:hypothetical protein